MSSDPVRLDVLSPAEAATVRRVALRHIAARQPVNCFVRRGAASMVAWRSCPEQVGTRIISANFKFGGVFTTVERVDAAIGGAITDAFRSLDEDVLR